MVVLDLGEWSEYVGGLFGDGGYDGYWDFFVFFEWLVEFELVVFLLWFFYVLVFVGFVGVLM